MIGTVLGGVSGGISLVQQLAKLFSKPPTKPMTLNVQEPSFGMMNGGYLDYRNGGIPVQTEKDEMLQYPNNLLTQSKAKGTHEQQSTNAVTEVVPNGTKVFSERNKYNKSQWKAINDVFGANLNLDLLDKVTKSKVKKISPSDIEKMVMSQQQRKSTPNSFDTDKLKERNKQSMSEQAFKFNQVVNPDKNKQGLKLPNGGQLGNNLYNLLLPAIQQQQGNNQFTANTVADNPTLNPLLNHSNTPPFVNTPTQPLPSRKVTSITNNNVSTPVQPLQTSNKRISGYEEQGEGFNSNALLKGVRGVSDLISAVSAFNQKAPERTVINQQPTKQLKTELPVGNLYSEIARQLGNNTEAINSVSRNPALRAALLNSGQAKGINSIANIVTQQNQQNVGLFNSKQQQLQQLNNAQSQFDNQHETQSTQVDNFKRTVFPEAIKNNVDKLLMEATTTKQKKDLATLLAKALGLDVNQLI